METAGFKTPVEDRYFEDYVPGSVHEFGRITVDEESIVAFGKQFDSQLFHTDPDREAVRILASGPGNLLFNWEVMVGVGQIWIVKLKLLPCFKTLRIEANVKSRVVFIPLVMICWLALLLVCIAPGGGQDESGRERTMQRLHLGEFLNERNRALRHTVLTAD